MGSGTVGGPGGVAGSGDGLGLNGVPAEELAPEIPPGVVLIGPPFVGKTRFLRIMKYAVALRPLGAPAMELSGDAALGKLLTRAADLWISGEPEEATVSVDEYGFSLIAQRYDAQNRPTGKKEFARFLVLDGPGGALVPDPKEPPTGLMKTYRSRLVEAGRSAQTLMLFIDTIDAKRRGLFLKELDRLMGEMKVSVPVSFEQPQGRMQKHFVKLLQDYFYVGSEPAPQRPQMGHYLNADRVVLVFNRIDQFCVELKRQFLKDGHSWRDWTPLQIASQLDPVTDVALPLLGHAELHNIRSSMKPGGQLAVALTSAGGFYTDTGLPFLNNDGFSNGIGSGTNSLQTLNRLTPFGVREALLFAGFGLPIGPVRVVNSTDLEVMHP